MKRLLIIVLMLIAPLSVMAQEETSTPTDELPNPASFFLRQWASEAEATSQYQEDSYTPDEMTGAPDTNGCGSNLLAWASENSTGIDDVTLTYETPVIPLQVVVYQNNNPGAITGIELIPVEGENIVVENSASPSIDCPSIFELTLDVTEPIFVKGVVIHLDQTITDTWIEIDAVELVGLTDEEALLFEYSFQWASEATASSEYSPESWNALQATGAPNTLWCGDHVTAWASAESTTVEHLQVTFDEAVIPVGVNIHQTYNPGAITSIELLTAEDNERITLPDSADPGTNCPGTFFYNLDASGEPLPQVNGVRLNLDQSLTGDWNEIDAVQLIGAKLKE